MATSETVTIVYDGEVSHRDSTGGGGTICPGDVQWMTAGEADIARLSVDGEGTTVRADGR